MKLLERPERWELIIVAAVTLGITVIIVGILLITRLSGRPASPPAAPPDVRAPGLQLSDFILESPAEEGEPWIFIRPPREAWDDNEIRRFWRDPAEAGLRVLSEENDELVKTYLNNLPD